LANRIFHRAAIKDSSTPLRAFVRGTQFQVRVWRALLKVQHGTLVSYGGLATILNRPTAARAVGSAVGQNPLAYLIPCHRVIRETGALGGYRWGEVRKQAILAWEHSSYSTSTRANHI
jgi:AraC family transcriptional regulator of adaptative response/methylated-DNA-[protein]-cysteine methyltransferase